MGTFHCVVDLQAASHRYIAEHNDDPKPFTWAETPEQIFANVLCLTCPISSPSDTIRRSSRHLPVRFDVISMRPNAVYRHLAGALLTGASRMAGVDLHRLWLTIY
jgi:hypothetical protein